MALVVLSKVEQRLDAVRAVLSGADVVEVAARVGLHRSTLHRWIARYLGEQLAGLADGRIDRMPVRARSRMRWRSPWRRSVGSIRGGIATDPRKWRLT